MQLTLLGAGRPVVATGRLRVFFRQFRLELREKYNFEWSNKGS